jgi:hypothetical protein
MVYRAANATVDPEMVSEIRRPWVPTVPSSIEGCESGELAPVMPQHEIEWSRCNLIGWKVMTDFVGGGGRKVRWLRLHGVYRAIPI